MTVRPSQDEEVLRRDRRETAEDLVVDVRPGGTRDEEDRRPDLMVETHTIAARTNRLNTDATFSISWFEDQ